MSLFRLYPFRRARATAQSFRVRFKFGALVVRATSARSVLPRTSSLGCTPVKPLPTSYVEESVRVSRAIQIKEAVV